MERVIVERNLTEPLTMEQLRASTCSSSGCFALYRVRAVRSVMSGDGRRVICEFEAPDAESVRRAQLSAKLPFDVIWTAQVLENDAADPPV